MTNYEKFRSNRDIDTILADEGKMIDEGTWAKYLFDNIACENLRGYDALCVSDASDNKIDGVGSFGVIVIPLKNGLIDGDIIAESALLKDIDNRSFTRIRYDRDGAHEDIIDVSDVYDGSDGYVKSGEADRAESESATRTIEICMEKGWNKIVYISDCQPLLQAIRKGESKAPGNHRVTNTLKAWGGEMELRKVGSHTKAVMGEIYEFGGNGDSVKPWEFDRDKTRLYGLLNDLVDLMAKAEVKTKDGSAQAENKLSVHLIPNEDGTYPKSGAFSDINKIYDANRDENERRDITRAMVERIAALIKKAIENGNYM